MSSDCVFCKIVTGDIPADLVAQSDAAVAFHDLAPQAPVHVLVIPREHVSSADHLTTQNAALVGELVLLAQEVAEREGVRESGYRLVFNVGRDAQMSVPHVHLHVLGGRALDWPPG
jgi:histidine triad (HIT) family protein